MNNNLYSNLVNFYNVNDESFKEFMAEIYKEMLTTHRDVQYVKEHLSEEIEKKLEKYLVDGKFNININEKVQEFLNNSEKIKDIEVNINGLGTEILNKYNEIDDNKSDRKTELLNTMICDAKFFKLTNNTSYPSLQGGCLSEDGKYYYCSLITTAGGNEKGIVQKYSIGTVSDFSTWGYISSSTELAISHANDMQFYNGKIYLCNTNTIPTEIIVINPTSLSIENNINIKYGATAITFNKKLNQFITRRKTDRGIFDFYDVNFNYIKSSEVTGVTYDTVQGIDSDNDYIYELCSNQKFGSSIIAYDLKGNFIKRIGSNVMSEIEHMTNFDNYYITGYYKNGSNFLSITTLRTDKRLTGARYKLNQGRNTVLTGSTGVWNGNINLKFSKKYFSHLSFKISVDGIETETKILDITDYAGSHIINSFRMTGTGQVIFYRSLLTLTEENKMSITPFAFRLINPNGETIIKLYSSEPEFFTKANSISISNVCGQILCGQRVDE